jgi:hypothetical protein
MSNVEVMYSVYLKKTEQAYSAEMAMKAGSDSTLRHFAVRYSLFCGSLFSPAASCQSGQFNQKKLHFCNK